jgi:predicted dehydrogenase
VIRLGVVGAGTLAQRGLLPHLTLPDVQDRVSVTAICDPVEGRAARAAERFGVPYGFSSYEELLGEVDAVTIASPIGLHYEQGRQALAAGKHVHFNKTMATTAVEATELIELARERDLRLVASPGEMLRPHNQELRRRIAAGELGTLVWAICGAAFGSYHEDEPERAGADAIDPSWYFRRPGGGPLYDMTVYALHALTGILGAAKRVTALSGVRIQEREFAGRLVPTDADDNTLMLLDFGESLFAVAYGVAAGSVNQSFGARYFGTAGTLAGEEGDPTLLPHVVGAHREIEEQHVFEDVMQLVDWVEEGKPSIATAEHARHVIEIIEAAYRSAETGRTQDLRTTLDAEDPPAGSTRRRR